MDKITLDTQSAGNVLRGLQHLKRCAEKDISRVASNQDAKAQRDAYRKARMEARVFAVAQQERFTASVSGGWPSQRKTKDLKWQLQQGKEQFACYREKVLAAAVLLIFMLGHELLAESNIRRESLLKCAGHSLDVR